MGNLRNLAFWFVLFILLLMLFRLFSGDASTASSRTTTYSDFVQAVENGQVSRATLDGETVTYTGPNGTEYVTIVPGDAQISDLLVSKGVSVAATSQETSMFQSILLSLLPIMLLVGVWIYFMNRMQGGGKGGAMGFGKSRAKMLTEKQGNVTFDDVAGIDEAKEELEEIVDFLKNPQKFSRLGGKIPKGALLEGAPGTGKTLLARAIAGEAGVPFFSISGSDFVEMFVGVGASRVRDMFEQAKKMRHAYCLSMKSMRWAGRVVLATVVAMMSASKPSTSFWLKWTVLKPMRALLSWRRQTAKMCLIPRCCARVVLIGR